MAEISQNVNIEMLEKLPDGTYKRKYPKTRADDGTTFDEHLAEKTNPHEVTKAQVGLSNVDNVKQASKTEFDDHLEDGMAHGIGNKNTLLTTNKSTLVGAMNELFTNVSSGKDLVGGAITDVDDSIVIPADPTFNDLANAIGGISTGVKMASGIATVSSSSASAAGIVSGTQVVYPITVTGLTFRPTKILAFSSTGTRFGLSTYIKDSNLPYPEVMATSYHNYTNTTDYSARALLKGDARDIYVTETGFRIGFITSFQGLTAHWFAFGD